MNKQMVILVIVTAIGVGGYYHTTKTETNMVKAAQDDAVANMIKYGSSREEAERFRLCYFDDPLSMECSGYMQHPEPGKNFISKVKDLLKTANEVRKSL